MFTVYKYNLNDGGVRIPGDECVTCKVVMPEGAEILCVGGQYNDIYLWAEVDTVAEPQRRIFMVYPTGVSIKPKSDIYRGTAHLDNGTVWHVYEKEEGA
jgi:hypothetical protein